MADKQTGLKLLQPTLFVGLGGVGATIVNRIAGILKEEADAEQYENIFQYFVLDTDRAMIDDCPHIPLAQMFIISGFDKGLYSALKRGRVRDPSVKPDPRAFLIAVARCPAPAARVVYVDDRADNVAEARRAGLNAYQVVDRAGVERVLEAVLSR